MLRSYTKPTVALARASVSSRSIYTHPSFKLSDPSLLVSTGWVNGRPLEAHSGDTYNLTDPATNQTWHSMADLGVHETEQAIQAAHDAFPAFSAIPARTRGRMIMEMDRLFLQAKDDLAQIAVMECGKTLQEALGELGAACELMSDWCDGRASHSWKAEFRADHQRRSLG
jgi:acyl-CoA reductase-like NAD-dependent aldehyde dehydrogenase